MKIRSRKIRETKSNKWKLIWEWPYETTVCSYKFFARKPRKMGETKLYLQPGGSWVLTGLPKVTSCQERAVPSHLLRYTLFHRSLIIKAYLTVFPFRMSKSYVLRNKSRPRISRDVRELKRKVQFTRLANRPRQHSDITSTIRRTRMSEPTRGEIVLLWEKISPRRRTSR